MEKTKILCPLCERSIEVEIPRSILNELSELMGGLEREATVPPHDGCLFEGKATVVLIDVTAS